MKPAASNERIGIFLPESLAEPALKIAHEFFWVQIEMAFDKFKNLFVVVRSFGRH